MSVSAFPGFWTSAPFGWLHHSHSDHERATDPHTSTGLRDRPIENSRGLASTCCADLELCDWTLPTSRQGSHDGWPLGTGHLFGRKNLGLFASIFGRCTGRTQKRGACDHRFIRQENRLFLDAFPSKPVGATLGETDRSRFRPARPPPSGRGT
jgi:hypothetical protein